LAASCTTEEIDQYINSLCESILKDDYVQGILLKSGTTIEKVDVSDVQFVKLMESILSEVIKKAVFLYCLKYTNSIDGSEKKSHTTSVIINDFIASETKDKVEKNDNVVQNLLGHVFKLENNNEKTTKGSFRSTLENMIINNIFSTIIQDENINPEQAHNILDLDINFSEFFKKYETKMNNLDCNHIYERLISENFREKSFLNKKRNNS
jgi:hypothetical protein